MKKILNYIQKKWIFILNLIAWFIVYGNTNQVGLEALSGIIIFSFISKYIYDFVYKK